MNRALHSIGFHNRATGLVSKQIDRVCSVVPQQVIGPAAGLTQSVHVGATEEIGLHIHLLNVEFAGLDFVVHILVAGVETAGVTAHRHQTFFFGKLDHFVSVFPAVSQRNFHLHMFARLQASNALCSMHLCWGAQNNRIHFRQRQAVGQIGGDVLDAVFVGHFFGLFQIAADQRHHFHAIDVFDAVQVFDTECTGTCERYFDGFRHVLFLRLFIGFQESHGPPRCSTRAHGKNVSSTWALCP